MPNNPITNQDLLNLAKDIKSDLSSGNIKLSPKFQSPLIETAPESYGFGESKFDTSDISISHLQEEGALGDIRGQKQGALDKWANGITKAAGIAGTSILENTAGLLYGIGDAVIEQDLSKIYDNHFTRELDSFNNYLREQMPNYSTKVAEDYNILQKLGTTNFWSDQFLSGVAYSGAALATGYGLNKFASLAKLARAGVVIDEAKLAAEGSAYLDKVSRGIKIADAADFAKNAALMSHAESAIEARETKDSTKEQLIKDFTTKYGYEPDEKALKTIEDISNAAGNWGYVSNLAITGTTNALQFPKLLAKGYVANKQALNNIELQGEKFVAEQLNPTTELLKKMSQGVVTEGGQELSQLFSNKVLTDYYGRGFKDKKDQHDLVESIMVGFEQTLGTQEGWENFLLGALIGGPMQMRGAKSTAQEKNVRSQEIASLLNNPEIQKTIKNFDNFVRSSSYEKDKNDALIEGSKFDYLTAEFNQDKAIAKQFIDNNATDLLIKQYQDLSGMPEEEFKKLAGYEENKPLPKSQTEIINNAVNLVKEMDKAVTDIKTLFPYSEEKYGNPTNYDILTTNLWHYSTSINNVNKRIKDINNELFKIAADNNISIIDTKSGFAIEDNPLAAQQVNLLNQDLIKANILKKALVESYNKLSNPETQKAALEEIVKDAEVKAEESKQKVEDSKPVEQKVKEQVQTKKTEEGTISPNLYEEKIKLAKTEGELDLINDDLVEQDKHSPELTDLIAQKRVELQLNKPTEGSLEENLQTTIDENTIEQPPIPTLTPKVISKLKDNEDKTLDTHQSSGVSDNKGKFRTNQKTTVTNFAYLSYQYSTANEDEFTETLTTKFDDKGIPIRDKSDLILSTPEIAQGTELEFKIDSSYPNFEELSKSKDTTPIAIYLKGGDSPIAYVHTPEWIKKNVANDYIDQVLFETNEIRKQVFESDKPIEGVIKGKTIGRLNKIENQGEKNNLGYVNSPIEVLGKQSETNPNEFESGRIIVAKSQNTAIIGKNSQSKNLFVNDLIAGAVYLEIPTSLKDNYFATFVKVGTLKDINQTEVILKAIEQHLSKTGQKVNGHDLNTPKGLFDFIGELTFVGKGQKRDAQTLDFNITEEALFLNIGATKDIGFNFKSTVEKNLEKFNSVKTDLTNVLDNKYFNVKADKLDSKKEFKIFKVEGNTLIEDKIYKNYTEYLAKEILKSNIHPEFYGDTRTFFHQSNISFGLKEEPKSENKQLPKDEQKEIEEKLNLALEEDVDEDSLFGDNNETLNESPDFSNTNLKYYRIQDLSLEQQNQIIDSLVANINNLIEKDFSPNETFSKTYNQLKASYNNAVKAGNIDKARILKLAIDNWNPSKSFTGFKNLVEIKLAQLGTKIEDNNLQEEDGLIEKRNFSEGATFKVNPKDKASARIKRLLASIPKDEKSVVGLPLFYDYNELYNSLLTYLADTPFNEMVSELQELGTTKSEFRKVYDRLISLDKSIMNEFLTVMKNRYSEFLTPIADINANGVSLYFRKSNINSAESLIINNWLETFKSSDILEQVTEGENIGNLKINEAKSKELLDRYNKLLKNTTKGVGEFYSNKQLEDFSNFFKEIGINVSSKALEDLRIKSEKYYGMPINSLLSLKLSNIFKTLAGVNKNQNETDILFDKNNPFVNEEESLKILARVQKKYEENLINSSFKNATGNSVFAYNNPTYLTDQLLELNNPEYTKELEATPFASTSYYLEELAKPDSDFKKVFHISYLDAFRKAKSNEEAIEYSDMSKKLRELTKIALFQNQGKQTTNITGLTYSDKDQTTIVSVPRIDIGNGLNAWKDTDSEAFNHLRALAIAELKRISLTKEQINTLPKEQLIEGYHKGAKGGLIAFLFTKLNNSEILFPNGELVEDWADSNKEIYKLEIDTIIKQEVESWISDKMNTWVKEGLYNSYEDNLFDKSYLKGGKLGIRTKVSSNDDVLEYAASDYVINYAIANGNLIQVLHGDLALAGKKGAKTEGYIRNTYVNYFKRLAKDIAPGVESPNTESKTSILYLKDVDFRNEYVNKFFKDDKSKKINGTDAQGIITTKHYLTKLFERGLIKEPVFNSMINKIKEFPNNYDAKFTNEERAVIFQPRKPVYVKGNIENGVNKIVYLKLSDYPLLPSLTKNTKLDNLRKLMESENGVDLAIFESGAKLGMQKATNLYDDKGNWVLTEEDIINNRVYLDSTGFKIQQDNPLKDSKKILEATQQRKLLFVDIPENVEFTFEGKTVNKKDLKKKFDDLHIELLEQKFNNLLEEFNIKTDDKGQYSIESMTKFHEFIMKEAIDREWNPNELASIQLDKDNRNFVLNLMYLPNAEKLESLFTSILTNNVVKNKLPGHSYIQGSSIGYESAEKNVFSDPEYKYMQKDETGYYSEVAIAWPYKNLSYSEYVNEDGTPKAEMFDKEMLYLIGYRIPNQGHNSMSRLKIKRFLRPEVGDLMLVPSEITLQMGSDFDVDKMYSYTYNPKIIEGKITKYKFDEQEIRDLFAKKNQRPSADKVALALGVNVFKEDYEELVKDFKESDEENIQNLIKKAKQKVIENSIVEVNDSVLSNEYLKDKIQQPLGFDALQEAVDKISKLNKSRQSEYSILYDETSDASYVANKSGKLLTGTTSLSATNHALAQEAHLYIKRNPKNDTEISVLFKDENNKIYEDLSKEIINDRVKSFNDYLLSYPSSPLKGAWRLDKNLGFNGTPISFVISGLQSAAVDNAKEQLMGKANINKHTYGVGALIARTGFDEEFIVAFLNQDVIHTMVDELEKLNDPTQDFSKKIKKKDLLSQLLSKYEKLAGVEAIDEIRAFSKQEMFNMLSYETQKQQGNIAPEKLDALEKFYSLGQAQILYNFIKYDEVASELTTIQNALTPETQGVGKSMSEMLYKQAQIEKVQLGGKYIANVDNLFNKTYIGQVIDKAIFKGNSIFKNLYPYSDKSYNFIEESIVEQIGDDRQLSSEELDKIYKEVKSSLFTKDGLFTSDIENERLRLLIDTFTLNKGVKTFTTKSLAQRLFEYKGNNPFFKKLSTELTIKSGEPSYVLYNASLVEEDTESFQNSINWQEGLKSGNLEEKQLAEDLVLYAYLTGGVQTKSSFVKFVPAEYLIEKIGTKKIIDFSDPTAFVYITKQFFQHNPWRARQIKQDWSQVNLKEKGLPESFTVNRNNAKSAGLLIEYKNEVKLPEYLSYKTKDKWLLYENTGFNATGENVYERVNTLGGFNLKEYNINQDNDKSIISSNNPVKVKSKPETKGADLNNNQIEQVQPIAPKDVVLTQMIEKNQLGDALQYIENLGGRYGVLAGILKDKISGLHTSIDTSISSKGQQEGSQIKINPNNNDNLEQLSDTILHETLHGITVGKIEAFEQGDFTKLTQSEIDTLESLKTLMKLSKTKIKDFEGKQNKLQEYIKKYKGLDLSPNEIEEAKQLVNEVYGLTNLKEFVTMSMTNKVFQGVLNEIPFGKKTLLDRFLDLIKKLVGFEVKSGSVLEQAINDVLTLIETKSSNPLVSTNELIDLNGNKVTKLTDYIKSAKSITREDIMDILISNQVANTKTGQLLMTIGDRTQEQKNTGYRGDKYYENKKKLQYVQREFPGLLDLTETPSTFKIAIRQDFIDKFNSGTQLTLNLSPSFKTKTTGDLGLDKYISKWDNQIRILKGQKTKNPEQAAEKQAAIDVLEKRKSELIEEKSIDLIFDTANVQLKQVEELLKQDEQTEESLQKALNYIAGWEDIGEIFDFEPNSDNAKVLGEIITSSVYLRKKWSEVAKQYLADRAKTIRPEWTYDKLFKEQIDTSFGSSMFFDSSVSSVAIEQFLDKLIKDTSFRVNSEVDEKSKEIDDKIKAIGGKKAFTKLLQTYENGKLTGNLVSPIKQEYYDKVNKLAEAARSDSKQWKQYWDFVKSNSYVLTIEEAKSGKSTHFTQKEIDKQLELLDVYEKQRVKFIEEEKERLSYSSSYQNKDTNEQEQLDYERNLAENIESWERENSPYLREQYEQEVNEGKRKAKDLRGMKGYRYLIYPKPKEQWQDPKYKALTKEQLEFLEYFKDTIEEYLKFLPVESDIQSNYIPEIRKGLIERIVSDKNTKILSGIGSSFIEKITTDFISEREYGVIDEETGKPIRQLRTGMLAGKLSANEKSYDLGSVLKEFVFMASAIKYKSEVEFQVTLGEKLLNEIEEQAVSPDGIKRDWQNNPIKITNGLNNTKERVNYLIDTFYGIRKDIEGVSKEIKSGPLKGKRLAGSKIGDSINQLTTAKGLALNPFSGMVNLFFGKISNRIHASSNQEFGDGDLNKAEAIVATSIFNSKGTKEKLALLMDKLQVLGDINHANYGGKSSFDKLYIFQRMGEFMVQAEAMTAILIKNDLWSKVEVKDGQLVFPEGFTEKEIIALSDKIQQTIKYLHGNYQINSPTRIKKHIWGRMLMVFRNWIPYSLQNRFGREMVDYRLGRTKKGRYITYGTLGFTGSMKTLLKLSVLGKVTGQKLEGVSEVDEANMRQNLRELSYMASMYLMTMVLSGLAKGTDDEDEKAVYTYFLNMASRTESDIWFYVSPKAFNQIIKDPIPSLKTFNDFVKLVNSTGHWVIGDDEIKYGKHKGESGLVRSFKQNFPVLTQLVNLETLSEKAFE